MSRSRGEGEREFDDLVDRALPGQHGGGFYRPSGTLASTPLHLSKGDVIGDFELIELIGQGGMGQVWLARQPSLGNRHVAMKFLRGDAAGERAVAFFEREARAGGRLNHPGIVSALAHGWVDGHPWLAMEYVEGHWDLGDYLAEVAAGESLPEDYDREVALFIARVAEAMQVAHDAGVIHRDLKPRNILVRPDNRPAITDFGLARITDESELSQTGDFAGTYAYMSPEQVAARRAGIDHRTDIFSLGSILYEMLTLQRPFRGQTTHEIAQEILVKQPPRLRAVRRSIPEDLSRICERALQKDRDRRFSTMAELAADLRRYMGGEPVDARTGGWSRGLLTNRVALWGSWIGGLTGLLLVAGFAWKKLDAASGVQAGGEGDRRELSNVFEEGSWSVHDRAEWHARALVPEKLTRMGEITRITLHWSALPEQQAPVERAAVVEQLRDIEAAHVDSKSYGAIGYHYLVDGGGEVWEGRPIEFQGAHAGSSANNAGNVGVCVLAGAESELGPELFAGLDRTLDSLRETYGLERSAVLAHSDLKNTLCPGPRLHEFLDAYTAGD